MISHFLKRDFQDSIAAWIILSLLSSLILVSYALKPSENLMFGLGYLFFMFSIFQIATLMGNISRADHIISRQYFLALPAKRNSLFFILLLRIFIFNLPLWIYLVFIAPMAFRIHFTSFINSTGGYFIYFYCVSMGLIWFLSSGLLQALIMERSLHHSSSRKRLLSGLIPAIVSGLGFLAIVSSTHFALKLFYDWTETTHSFWVGLGVFSCLLVPTVLVLVSMKLAQSRWTSVS